MNDENNVVVNAGDKFKKTYNPGWHCAYCHKKTTFDPERLIKVSSKQQPDMGLLIVSDFLICEECHKLKHSQ